MIDFACKQFQLNDVIKCGLGLTKADFKVLDYFMNKEEWLTAEIISRKLKLNLSTVQRAVKKLFEKSILKRSQENLDQGGYIFQYQIKTRKEVKAVILEVITNWHKKVDSALKDWSKA